MGPYLYYYPLSAWTIYTSPPLKARKAEAYALTRRSNVEAPNVYFSRDLRQFRQLSHSYPQKDYNWMTSQLVHWNRLDGKKAEGILYKPENFDSTKKYPVIFYFYEKDADAMYDFIFPALNTGELDIPLFVSNGYLVIDPNIYYTIPNPGSSVINSVVSAAKFLSTLSYVDPTRMGVQGISFGGYEVNYLITHSHLFAAAAEAAGPVDFISGYGSLNGRGESLAFQYELAQNRLGATLWQRPDLYIRNSPIFRADKITTPLLIMHNKEDEAVPFAQGVELFTALRRLGKPVWMLQYDGEGHGVERPVNQFDYSQRLAQFFDHFLKGAPAPKWMTSGIPAERKGVDSGLEMEK
jgi:dipeptidyl aminopeptidase/acylaminoacyl peptidase